MPEITYIEDVYDDDNNLVEPGFKAWNCGDCGERIYRFRGDGDVKCENGHWHNSFGQRLRDDWMDNPSWKYGDVDDLTGFEMQHAGDN